MAKLILRQEAIDDLTNIYEYTVATWSENQADKYYETIKSACRKIANNPSIGKKYIEISNNFLAYRVNKHIIFYQVISDDEIEIIIILHERMDLKNSLSE